MGQATTYEYDHLGRLRKVNYGVVNGTPAFSVNYTFDANGNRTAMTDQAGSSSWTYDKNNRLLSEARTQNGVTKTASYSYAQGGQLTSMRPSAARRSATVTMLRCAWRRRPTPTTADALSQQAMMSSLS